LEKIPGIFFKYIKISLMRKKEYFPNLISPKEFPVNGDSKKFVLIARKAQKIGKKISQKNLNPQFFSNQSGDKTLTEFIE
jgi:hypothetical protein